MLTILKRREKKKNSEYYAENYNVLLEKTSNHYFKNIGFVKVNKCRHYLGNNYLQRDTQRKYYSENSDVIRKKWRTYYSDNSELTRENQNRQKLKTVSWYKINRVNIITFFENSELIPEKTKEAFLWQYQVVKQGINRNIYKQLIQD